MAYNYFPQYLQYPQIQNQVQQQQIQNGGFVLVRSEDEARNYPVALGNSITFKDETAPYIYTKTMGFSQMDRPMFERYKLIKENASESPKSAQTASLDKESIIITIDELKAENEAIWREIEEIKNAQPKAVSKQAVTKRDKTGDD